MTITTPGVVPDPTPLQLANITVDYAAIDAAYAADLQRQGSWSSLLPAGTGSAIRRWVSSAITSMLGGVARALQETYPSTARTPGGILRAQLLFQGSSIIRRRAGAVPITVTRTDLNATALTVAALTPWRVGGVDYFNRAPVVVPGTGQIATALYQGTIAQTVVTTDATPFQRFVLGEPYAWDIGNDDLVGVDALGGTWTMTARGLWREDGDAQVFRASTQPDGTVEIVFGMGEDYGAIPPPGTFTFTYASVVSAVQSLNAPLVGSAVMPVDAVTYTLAGTSTGGAAPNQDQPPPEFYKSIGPGTASNNGRSVSRADYRAMALAYPGVVDAVFRPQRQLNPSDVRWMNIVAVTLLTTAPWSSADWLTFKAYFEEEVAISNAYLIRVDPVPVAVPVQLVVGSTTIADDAALTSIVNDVIATYFTPRSGILGMTVYPSDLTLGVVENATYQQAPNEAGELVDYVDCVHPRAPVVLDAISYPVAGAVSVNVVKSARGQYNESTGQVLGTALPGTDYVTDGGQRITDA